MDARSALPFASTAIGLLSLMSAAGCRLRSGAAAAAVLVNEKHFDSARFFRVIKGYVAQFGLSGDPKVDQAWRTRRIEDDSVKHNAALDAMSGFGFPPVAEVVSGMPALDSLYSGYGDSAPRSGSQPGSEGPSQDSIVAWGNAYLERGWPKLDYIKTARVVQQWRTPNAAHP